MAHLPYVTKHECESDHCLHCNGTIRDKDYMIYASTHNNPLPHHIYSFMVTITDQNDVWEPSCETLINIAVPCLTCTENYVEQIAKFRNCTIDSVQDKYENDSDTYTVMCHEYLTHLEKTELLTILSDLARTECDINHRSNTYTYQLLQYGIITPNNWNLLCPADRALIKLAYGVQQLEDEKALLYIMMQHMEALIIIRQIHPEIFSNEVIVSLWAQCNKIQTTDHRDYNIRHPSATRPINIQKNKNKHISEPFFQMDEEIVDNMSKTLPSSEISEKWQHMTDEQFIPPHLLTDRTGFTPPPRSYATNCFSI